MYLLDVLQPVCHLKNNYDNINHGLCRHGTVIFMHWSKNDEKYLSVQFMANARELPKVQDVHGYNHALGKTFIGFGCLLIPMFIPLFLPMPMALIMIFCMPFWAIGLILRCMQIQSKYEK